MANKLEGNSDSSQGQGIHMYLYRTSYWGYKNSTAGYNDEEIDNEHSAERGHSTTSLLADQQRV